MQEEVAEQPRRIIIVADLLAEATGSLQDRGLFDRQAFCGNTDLGEPLFERSIGSRHSHTPLQLQVV